MSRGTFGTFNSTATETFDSVAAAQTKLSYNNNGSSASPMPTHGSMTPIYELFAYQDVCDYEFNGINCSTVQ